jgi:hypothetical protein
MVELEKRITGDWIDLRSKANDFHEMLDALAIPPSDLRVAAEALRHSVEQGIVEYKRTLMMPVFSTLEAARYTTIPPEEMGRQEGALTVLLFVILTQRLLSAELLPLSRRPEEKRSFGVDTLQVGAILADVNARLKQNPALRASGSVKTILAQVQRYNGENRKMRELLPTIKPEMRTSFLANFTRTFDEIIGSIRRNYQQILQEEHAAQSAGREGFSLSQVAVKELVPLFVSQAQEVARIRSTLAHARDEKYKTREFLVRLYDGRQAAQKLIEDESRAFRKICDKAQAGSAESCAQSMANAFRDEIVMILEKQGKKDEQP